jgi:hypothetical protein
MTAAGEMRLAMVGVAVIPAAYAWWSAWRVVRSREDASLPERLFARTRRVAAVTLTLVMMLLLSGEIALAAATVVALLVAWSARATRIWLARAAGWPCCWSLAGWGRGFSNYHDR